MFVLRRAAAGMAYGNVAGGATSFIECASQWEFISKYHTVWQGSRPASARGQEVPICYRLGSVAQPTAALNAAPLVKAQHGGDSFLMGVQLTDACRTRST